MIRQGDSPCLHPLVHPLNELLNINEPKYNDTTNTTPDRRLCDANRLDGEKQDEEQPRRWFSRSDLFATIPTTKALVDSLRGDPRDSLPDRPVPSSEVRGLREELDDSTLPEMG